MVVYDIAPAGTGRELVHIEFNGSWSSYEINYADTSNTTITTYQMSYEYYSLTRGEKNYELSNHLGNVLAVISDKRIMACSNDTVDYYSADLMQATDYSAFGVLLEDREWYADTSGKYRYGFNSIEKADEVYGAGNYIDLGERGYDTRLGRLNWSPDPLAHKFVGQSPYAYAANNPIRLIDVNGLGPGDPVGQGYYNAFSTTREIGFFLRHPIYATKIGLVTHGSTNISTNATRFSINTNLPENKAMEGSHRNAYRHVLWQSTITTQFGASIARQVGNAHESNPSADLTQRSGFKTLANADQTIDLLNNQIGIQIGTANPNASMQELAIKTLDYFKTNGLYTATKQEDGTYSITQTKLTEEQYKAAMQTIKTTNNNGYTPPQQQAADEEALKQQQLIESTNPTY